LTDATTVGGTAWSDLKAVALLNSYDSSSETASDQALVAALIIAQNSTPLPTLTATPYTYGHSYSDAEIIASTTWGLFKEVAMEAGFSSVALSASDQEKVQDIITAQAA